MAIDVFQKLGRSPDELHPQFRNLLALDRYGPARGLIRELQQEFSDPDGNFVEQFQTSGFDARTFELFLYSAFREMGYAIDRSQARPDFLLSKDGTSVAVEAVVASPPSVDGVKPYFAIPPIESLRDRVQRLQQNVPIRLGSPLFSKLQKKYWTLPHVAGRPLVFAIQDFSGPGSLLTSSTPLAEYLYGAHQCWYHDDKGKLIITEEPIGEHIGVKRIPSGFFKQLDANFVSAVLFCNTGTVPKFNRMGHQGKYYDASVRMVRYGSRYDHNPDAVLPKPFAYEVGRATHGLETWREGTVLMLNPRATYPLPKGWFGAALEMSYDGGENVQTFAEPFFPYQSITQLFSGSTPTLYIDWYIARKLRGRANDHQAALVTYSAGLWGRPRR